MTRGQGRNSAGLSGPLAAAQEQETDALACSPSRGPSWSLKWGEGGVRGWLGWSADPLVVLCPGTVLSALLLLLAPGGRVAVQFRPFCVLFFIICPICACMKLFLVPYSFFVFCCWRGRGDARPGVSTEAWGPRSQPARQPSLVIVFINKRIPDSISPWMCVSLSRQGMLQ